MPLNDTILNVGAAAMQAVMTHASLFTAAPNAAGTTNNTTHGRQAVTWITAANGDMVATVDLAFTGGAASGGVAYIGFWSASSAGTFYGYVPVTGDTTSNSAGEYTVTDITITGTAS